MCLVVICYFSLRNQDEYQTDLEHGGNVGSRRRHGIGSPITGRIDDIVDMQAMPNPPFVSAGTPVDQNHTHVPVNPQPSETCTGQVIPYSHDLAIITWETILRRLPQSDQNLLYLYRDEVPKYFDMYWSALRELVNQERPSPPASKKGLLHKDL